MLEGCAARHQHHRSARSLAHSVTFPYSLTRFYLHVVNYIEHYGLVRENKGAVLPAHSWNASTTFGNAVTYNLQRHSDHHASAQKPYYALESIKDAPQLPAGYPGMSRNTRLRACLRTCLLARMPRLTHPARPVVASHDVVEHGMFFSSGAPKMLPLSLPLCARWIGAPDLVPSHGPAHRRCSRKSNVTDLCQENTFSAAMHKYHMNAIRCFKRIFEGRVPQMDVLTRLVCVLALVMALSSVTLANETCKKVKGTEAMACTLTKMADCDAIDTGAGLPYILGSCKNTFSAVESIVKTFAKRTGRQKDQIVGSVEYVCNPRFAFRRYRISLARLPLPPGFISTPKAFKTRRGALAWSSQCLGTGPRWSVPASLSATSQVT